MTVKRAPNGTYTVQFRCKDAEGRELHKFRRGFATRSKAEEWERDYKATRGQSMAMKFYDFLKIYEEEKTCGRGCARRPGRRSST